MMNKLMPLLIIAILLCACGKREEEPENAELVISEDSVSADSVSENISENEVTDDATDEAMFIPDIARVRSIAMLSSLKCIYHNVAYGTQQAGTGLVHAGEKARSFMQEYDCEVEISYNVGLIEMSVEGNEVRISLPEPELSTRKIPESIDKYSYIEEPDQLLQTNPILAETIEAAVAEADAKMEEEIRSNSSLLQTAEDQLKSLVENYIRELGRLTDTEYIIIWE